MPIRVVKVTGDEMREEASVEDKKKKKKMLIGGQAKLDKNKNNKIDAEDFAILRREKSPMKAKRGRLAGQDFSERMKNVERGLINKKTGNPTSMAAMRELKGFKPGETPKEFNKRMSALAATKEGIKRTRIGKIALGVAGAGIAAKAFLDKKKKEAKEKKQNKKMGGGMMKSPMKAKRGKFLRSDTTKPISSVQPSTTLPKDFVGKRKALGGAKSALGMLKGPAKAGALLGVALAVPVGKVLKKVQDKRKAKTRDKAKVKKMGGGLAAATERLKAQGKMGGGMMKPQKAVLGMLFRKKRRKATPGMKMVDSSPGGFGLLGRLAKKVGLQKGGGADTGTMGEIKSKLGVAENQIRRMKIPGRITERDLQTIKEIMKNRRRGFKPSKTTQRIMDALGKRNKPVVAKKMGGGMMQPAMPMYKKGKMIKARGGGLAKTKPTKMY